MSATPLTPASPNEAWPVEGRRQMMRDVIRLLAERGALKIENAPAIAKTYSVLATEVEAEMLKHRSEGGDK